jgi:RNA polymerase sigma factor (sigma-70 family)
VSAPDPIAEAEAIASWQAGDILAGDRLVRMHAGLIHRAVRCYESDACEIDDLMQMGRLALLDSALRYDATGEKFSTFAYRGMWWAARGYSRTGRYIVPGAGPVRRMRDAHRFAMRLDAPAREDGTTLRDLIPAPESESVAASAADVAPLLACLPANQRDVIELHYGAESLTLEQIGEARGISKQAAHAAKDRALARLRAAVGLVSDKCTSNRNAALAKRRVAAGSTALRCSLCNEERHNRRTCPCVKRRDVLR